MKKKYTVFVSSTFNDLIEERGLVLEGIIQADFIPVGMEYFAAATQEQFSIIKRMIDDSDFYVVIIGGRYGSINEETGLSYTEMEFNYAIERDIPVLVFAHEDILKLDKAKRDTGAKLEKLNEFRAKAMSRRLVKQWDTKDKLALNVIISLNNAKADCDRPGWVRGGGMDNTELLTQLNNVRAENEELRSKIQETQKVISEFEKVDTDLAFEDEKIVVKYASSYGYSSVEGFKRTTLKEIFAYISLRMLNVTLRESAIENAIFDFVGIGDKAGKALQDKQFMKLILNQFVALGLIKTNWDQGLWYGLTKKGIQMKNELNLIKKKTAV